MKKQAGEVQYTIRGVPKEVDRELRRKAAQQKRSLNQVVIEELIGATSSGRKREDFSDVVGKWTEDPEFDAILAEQRVVDLSDWS